MQSIQNYSPWLVGIKSGTTTWEDNLAVSYKIKQTFTICPSNSIPTYFPK